MPRLSNATLPVPLPYNRQELIPGIFHIGVGAFHRAHIAAYVDRLLPGNRNWGIIGASLRSPATQQALAPQDYLYSHVTRGGSGTEIKVIGSLLSILDAGTQRKEILEALSSPDIRIVTMTVTEKGYCHDPATGRIDPGHPDVRHDLEDISSPRSTPGILVRALELRRAAKLDPFTILCCDNLPSNGETAKRVIAGFADLRDPALAAFVERDVAFPSSMVDRIVPATTDDDRKLVQKISGLEDAWPVVTEPFSQWVIEDKFSNGRPLFEDAGAQMVSDVKPYEHMKLRMLNGSHSTLAYLGYLAGYEFVSQAIADPALNRLIHDLMTFEVMPTLPRQLGGISGYRDDLLARFSNPAIKHRTWQIAMDGSQKLPQRLLGTIRQRLDQRLPVERLALGVAGWMRYVTGTDEHGAMIDVRDPMADRLREIASRAGNNPSQLVAGLLSVKEIFGEDLIRHEEFRSLLTRHLTCLFEFGVLATVRQLLANLEGSKSP